MNKWMIWGVLTHYFRKHDFIWLVSTTHPPTTGWALRIGLGRAKPYMVMMGMKASVPFPTFRAPARSMRKMSDFSDLFPSRMFLGGFVEIRMAEYFGGWEKKQHPINPKNGGSFSIREVIIGVCTCHSIKKTWVLRMICQVVKCCCIQKNGIKLRWFSTKWSRSSFTANHVPLHLSTNSFNCTNSSPAL